MEHYVLAVGQKGAERLSLLNNIHWPYSLSFLKLAGLRNGMRVLDVGCGVGNTTYGIAQTVNDGEVIGIDNNQEQLKIAKSFKPSENIRNARFINIDLIQASPERLGVFDLVYCRFFLGHVRDAYLALRIMKSLTKEGGILVCEEPDIGSGFAYPISPAFNKVEELFIKLGRINNLDFRLGCKLCEFFVGEKLHPNAINVYQPVLRSQQEKRLFVLGLRECKNSYIIHCLCTEEEIKILENQLENFTQEETSIIISPRVFQVSSVVHAHH